MWPRRSAVTRALVLGAMALVAGRAAATHLPDHRFIVVGYVTDSHGRPVAGSPVVVTRLQTGLDYPVRTEGDGFYLVVVHLHDEDEGERLSIRAGEARGEVRARFDPRDKKVERGTRVDVRASTLVESRPAFAETLRAYLAR